MPFAGTPEFLKELNSRKFLSSKNLVKIMNGEDVYGQYFAENGFSTPVLVPDIKGLRIKVPDFDFTLDDVVKETDPDALIDVILVRRQNVQKMPLKYFVDCFFEEPRMEVLNSLSFEFSKTDLSKIVQPPHVVSELCLVENIWPDEAVDDEVKDKPNVQKYCIMSMAESYTDFHVDFGGSSVWYHVLWGEKIFYLIAPTPENLDKYWEWHALEDNRSTYFPDYLEKSALMNINGEDVPVPPVYRLKIFAGQTIFLPSGWIHAVYTPQDSLVFGGNFLTKLTVPIQLSVYRMEEKTKTEEKFLFPYFEKLHWLLADYILGSLQNHKANKTIPEYFIIDAAICLIFTLEKWLKKRNQMLDDVKYQYLPEVSLISTKNHSLLIKELDKLIKTSIPKNYRDSTVSPTKKSSPNKKSPNEGQPRGRSKKKQAVETPVSSQGFRPVGGGIAAQMKITIPTPLPINPILDNGVSSRLGKKDGFSHLIGLPPVKKVQKPSIEEKLFSPQKSGKRSRRDNSDLEDDDEESPAETEPTTDFNSTDSEDTLPKIASRSRFAQSLIKGRSRRSIKPNRKFLSSEEDGEDEDAVDADRQRLVVINKTISGNYISNFSNSDKSSSDYCPSESESRLKKPRKTSKTNDPSWREFGSSSSKKKPPISQSSKQKKLDSSNKKSSAAFARQRLAKRLGIK